MTTKGIAGNFQAWKDLILRILKGVPKSAFKIEVGKCGRRVADQFDNCVLALAKLFFSEDYIDNQTEHARNVCEPLEDTMQ